MERIVVGYVRVSTNKADQSTSVDGQLHDLRARWQCDHIIAERKGAYVKGARPGWEELRGLVAQRKVRLVVVADQSRMARDLSDQEFLEECALVGTRVVNVHGDEIENQSVNGLLSTGLMSVVNRVQSRQIGVRVREGVRRRREAGFYGRGQTPFGYQFEGGHIRQHPEHWQQARWLVEEVLRERCNLPAVIRNLPGGFPRRYSRKGLLKWLTNPILRGGVGLGLNHSNHTYREVVWGMAPALLSLEEWRTISRQLEIRSRGRGGIRGTTEHLFSGLIRCEGCKRRLWWAAGKKNSTPRYCCGTIGCQHHHRGVHEAVVAAAVKQALTQAARMLAMKAAEYAARPPKPTAEELRLRAEIEAIEAVLNSGSDNHHLDAALRRARNQLVEFQAIPFTDMPVQVYQRLFAQAETWDLATKEELRAVVVEVVERVEFDGPDLPVVVKLRDRLGSELGR